MPISGNQIFERVAVDFAVDGVTRVSWSLAPHFLDPGPYAFQLQVNTNGGDPATWENVGSTVQNTLYALDDGRNVFGKSMSMAYRVQLTTPMGEWMSGLAQIYGLLTYRQWVTALNIIRRAKLRPAGLENYHGWLFKRKAQGVRCTCVDPFTGLILNSSHAECNGTGIVDGYWAAAENTLLDMTPVTTEAKVDPQVPRGTADPTLLKARCVALPPVDRRDIWLHSDSGARYTVQKVEHTASVNQVPILAQLTLEQLPFSDIIYQLPLEGN